MKRMACLLIMIALLGVGCPEGAKVGQPRPRMEPLRPGLPGEERLIAGIQMVWVPPGTFVMGSPPSEPERDPEDEIQREVAIASGFWMGAYEVTQAQWVAVMGNDGTDGRGFQFHSYIHPAECVSWEDCQVFIQRLNDRTGLQFRLPTEPEWEYACRAGTTSPFNFGYAISTDRANYNGEYRYAGRPGGAYRAATTPVGSFPPNAWGLYDMHGNVWEWCQDRYGVTYNPNIDTAGPARVMRGGGWVSEPLSCRSAYSYALGQKARFGFLGLRLCLDAPYILPHVASRPSANGEDMQG